MNTPAQQRYRQYLKSDHWQQTRQRKLSVAGFECECCASPVAIQVHHLTYSTLFREAMSDLLVLCGECHKETHLLWPKMPTFPARWVRAMTMHFLLYHGRSNPLRRDNRKRRNANYGLNKLPNVAKIFLRQCKDEMKARLESV